jgi:hypothetical protein
MIALKRVRTAAAVHPNFCGPKRVELNLGLLKKKRNGQLEATSPDKWDSNVWKQAKEQLLVESGGKCAYCETPTTVIAYGDVEHFRPKSVYWWLAYSYENYLPSCTLCNQRYKKDFFPIKSETKKLKGPKLTTGITDAKLTVMAPSMTVDPVDDTAGMKLADFIKKTHTEQPLIINPYFDDPAEYLAYLPILETREVLVVPAKTKYKPIIDGCDKYFGINRPELRDLRFQLYCIYMTFRHILADGGISAKTRTMSQKRLDQMLLSQAPYAGMVRYFQTKKLADLPWDFDIDVAGGLAPQP